MSKITIAELLVRDGKWPTVAGPRGTKVKEFNDWLTFSFSMPKKPFVVPKGSGVRYTLTSTKPKLPTIECQPDEKGVQI